MSDSLSGIAQIVLWPFVQVKERREEAGVGAPAKRGIRFFGTGSWVAPSRQGGWVLSDQDFTA